MKEAKKQYYNTEILNCLIDGDVVSTQQIADAVGMSEKSIRNKIFDINEYLQENDNYNYRMSYVDSCELSVLPESLIVCCEFWPSILLFKSLNSIRINNSTDFLVQFNRQFPDDLLFHDHLLLFRRL